jgi:outer membrane protein
MFAALPAGTAGAQSSAPTPSADPLWEAGVVAFGLTQQAWPGASEHVRRAFAVPCVLYRGPLCCTSAAKPSACAR